MAQATSTQNAPVAQGGANALQGLTRLPIVKQLGLMIGLAASVAAGVGIVLWSQTPAYSLLYGNLSGSDATEVMEALQRADIPVRLDRHSGALLVPSGKVHDARLKLAAEGLPHSTDMGFEVLEKEQGFGTSQFVERARYQRALEVELARSISKVNSVQNARVHLAVPKQSVFVRRGKKPSASVLVHLYPGRTLEEGQVAAIAHLVAASVPNLEPSDVKVVDQKGRLLTAPDQDDDALLTRKQFDYTQRLERSYIKRIEDLLAPIVGLDGVTAQVVADVDFTRTEQTRELFEPDPRALRSEQVSEERGTNAAVGGIPGALSNQPPAAGQSPEDLQSQQVEGPEGAQGTSQSSRRRATRNFELDRTISHTTNPVATIRRLSVAVVVDDHRTPAKDGSVIRESLTPEELNRITGLVKEAVGYNEERGDSVSVINAPFTAPLPAEPLPKPPFWEQSWLWDLLKQIFGIGILLVLVFTVLRPAMRRLTSHELRARQLTIAGRDGGIADDRLRLSGNHGGVPQLPQGISSQDSVGAVQTMASEDPKRVAQVVRGWMAEDA